MKKTNLTLLALSFGVFANAQTLQDAITKTENERFEAAAADFRSLISKDATKGDTYFYFGENYFKNDNLDSAMIEDLCFVDDVKKLTSKSSRLLNSSDSEIIIY